MLPDTQSVLPTYEQKDMYERQQDAYAHAKYEILLKWINSLAAPSSNILNVGCGSGQLCFLLAQCGHVVTGIDPAAEYISIARALANQLNLLGCSFVVSDLEKFCNDPGQRRYDIVLSTDVIEHIANDEQAVQQLAALVQPGGDLFITVPGGQYLFGFHDEQLGHYRRYSLRQLTDLMPSNLKIKKLRYFGFSLIPVAWLYSQVLRRYYPVAKTGNRTTNPILAQTAGFVLSLEKRFRPPLGTSCLLWAKKIVS